MSDYPLNTRLREIESALRVAARSPRPADAATALKAEMEDFAEQLREIIGDLDAAAAEPQAGTHAYDLIAAAERQNVEVTETLIHMTAATVLYKLIEEEGGGRCNVSFSPLDMDAMHRGYEMEATHDGLLTTVRIKPRVDNTDAILSDSPDHTINRLMLQAEDASGAKPQAEANTPRPYWFVRSEGVRKRVLDREEAENIARESTDPMLHIENRNCPKVECLSPASQGSCASCNPV